MAVIQRCIRNESLGNSLCYKTLQLVERLFFFFPDPFSMVGHCNKSSAHLLFKSIVTGCLHPLCISRLHFPAFHFMLVRLCYYDKSCRRQCMHGASSNVVTRETVSSTVNH